MKFVIKSSNPYQVAPEMIRVSNWITERFGEFVSVQNPCTFAMLPGSDPKIPEVLELINLDNTNVEVGVLLAHESQLGFAVYQILFFRTDMFGPAQHQVFIIVSIDDEMAALECKLACI